jgi:hypothetical protein
MFLLCSVMPIFAYVMLPATTSGGESSVTTEDGRVRPKHDFIEFKK